MAGEPWVPPVSPLLALRIEVCTACPVFYVGAIAPTQVLLLARPALDHLSPFSSPEIHSFIAVKGAEAGNETARPIMVPDAEPEHLSSVPGTHMVVDGASCRHTCTHDKLVNIKN